LFNKHVSNPEKEMEMKTSMLAVALLLAGCRGPGYRIIKQAPATDLAGKTTFAIAPVDYSQGDVAGLTEAEYSASQDENGKHQWADVKSGIDQDFSEAVASKGGGLTFVKAGVQAALLVKPIVRSLKPGSFMGTSHLRLAVQITTPDGAILDEIELANGTHGNIYNPTDEKRLRNDAETIGENVGRYLSSRAKP
jgi:hypothetical protein